MKNYKCIDPDNLRGHIITYSDIFFDSEKFYAANKKTYLLEVITKMIDVFFSQ